MSFFKNIFGKKEEPIKDYKDFWNWFQNNGSTFFNVVKDHHQIKTKFFDKLSPKLEELNDGFLFLTGMYDDNTAELIFTADGNPKTIVFVEELVASAPEIDGWKFTACKPSMNIEDLNIEMNGYEFNSRNLFFYSNELVDYPDEIDISIVHNDLTNGNREQISNGVFIFMDNYLGELDFVNNIDNLKVVSPQEAKNELIPISKLKDFLIWRQKEFIERYEAVRYAEEEGFSILEGAGVIAVINTKVLDWGHKASHPWIATLTIRFKGQENNGMPNGPDYEMLNKIEDEILQELKAEDGYINIGRHTENNEREFYFTCVDFRKPSKILFNIQKQYSERFEMDYSIYKDKYWRSFNHYSQN